MAYLTGEMKDQLLPAMGHSPRDEGASDPRERRRTRPHGGNHRARRLDRTTAAWKPSGSARLSEG